MARFKINEEVMARWPGSALYFKGWVVDFNDIEYQIRFDDDAGSEFVVKYKDVKSKNDFIKRSSSKGRRSQSRGRSRSRGRGNRGRSPGRPKSPAQNRSPTKKSPGRPSKKVLAERQKQLMEQKAEKVITTTTTTMEEVTVLTRGAQEAEVLTWAKNESPVPSVRPRLARADLHTPRTSTPTRHSPRLANMNEKVNDVEVNNVKARSEVKASEVTEKRPGVGSRLCGVACGVGKFVKGFLCALVPSVATVTTVPALLTILFLPVVLNEMCTKKKCTVMELPSIPRSLQYYYDPMVVVAVLGFSLVQALLCLVPLGKKVQPRSGVTIRCNGFLAVVATLAVVPICLYLDYNILVFYSKFRHVMATFIALVVLLSLALYVKGRYAPKDAINPAGNTGCFLPDLFNGRELTPVVLSLDLKFVMLRIVCMTQLLINAIFVVKDLQAQPGQYSPTMLLAATMQIFYAASWIWFEDAFFTTYDYQKHGCGLLLLLADLGMPFIFPIFSRFVLNHRTELEWYWLTAITLLNLTGYTICRGANNQKHAFRSNPSDPALARLESLPTAAGTRLLVSGWWGLVRHPNYLGDIIIILSWALVCGFTHALPWVVWVFDVLFLVIRILQDEAGCRKKYGTAWDSYTNRVRSCLIPKVF